MKMSEIKSDSDFNLSEAVTSMQSDRMLVHASAISLKGRGVLLLGPSGSGKSSLARHMMERGWGLVGDDQIHIIKSAGGLYLVGDSRLKGRLEIRGVGLISVIAAPPVRFNLAVQLCAFGAEQRYAPERTIALLGQRIPIIDLSVSDMGIGSVLHLVLERIL